MYKRVLKIAGVILLFLVAVIFSLVTTIDRTPYQQTDYYRAWKSGLDSLDKHSVESQSDSLRAGWAVENLTPALPGPMAGYGKRKGKPFESVHDSIKVRTLLLESEGLNVAIVSADLLIIPPGVKKIVFSKKPEDVQIYFGATHSHNSIGGWYNTLVGELFAGEYSAKQEEHIASTILRSISSAQKTAQPVRKITYEKDLDERDVRNRLIENGPKDPYIRSLQITTDSARLALLTYSAHSTLLGPGTMLLSRDYPGVLVDSLENNGFTFAAYLAGAVGSMGPVEVGSEDFEQVKNQANGVLNEYLSANEDESQVKGSMLWTRVKLPLRKPSPKITPGLALRPWVFYWLFGRAPAEIACLKIGQVLMVGLPCDFSGELMGELESYAASRNLKLIITSFNGGYTGYITSDEHFDKDVYETVTMNWFGPYNGAYFSEAVKDLIDRF
jgi:hypothetical protein